MHIANKSSLPCKYWTIHIASFTLHNDCVDSRLQPTKNKTWATKKLWRCISFLQNQSQNRNSPHTCSVLLLILQALLVFLQEMQIKFKNRVWNRAHSAMINLSNASMLYCCHMTSSHACLIQLEVFIFINCILC